MKSHSPHRHLPLSPPPIPPCDTLHQACRQGRLDDVKTLLQDRTLNPNQRESTSREVPLLLAADSNHIAVVRVLLADDRVEVNPLSHRRGATPLWQACEWNHWQTVMLLLEDPRVNVNQAENGGEVPLWIACHNNLERLGKVLLASGRRVETTTRTNQNHWAPRCSPAQRAGMRRAVKMVEMIREYEENPVEVAARLKKELMWATEAAQIFALGIFLCDGILQLPEQSETDDEERIRMKRYFAILARLHLDLQMVLVNRTKRSSSSNIPLLDREIAFTNLAREM